MCNLDGVHIKGKTLKPKLQTVKRDMNNAPKVIVYHNQIRYLNSAKYSKIRSQNSKLFYSSSVIV